MKTHRIRTLVVAGITATTMGTSFFVASSAHADDPAASTDATVESADAGDIAQAQAESDETGDLAPAEDEFMEDQARMGNTVDASTINSAEVDDAVVVWEDGVDVDSLETSQITNDGEAVGTEISQVVVPDPAYVDAEFTEPDATGLGSDAITRMSGGNFNGGYCTTTTVSEQKLTQCFERYIIKNDGSTTRDYYYYGRWATAEGESNWGPLPDWIPTKIDIRSRPWDGKRSNFATLTNYWPKGSHQSCTDSGEISIGFKGFSGKMPIRNCSETNPIVDATNISMGSIYDQGASFSGRVHSSDFSMIVATFQGKPAPMGDYGYAKFCKYTYADCEGVLRKDGW